MAKQTEAAERDRERRRKARAVKRMHEKGLCVPKGSGGIGECQRWKTCRFGADADRGSGTCNYSEIMGRGKIITLPNGRRTVEPTKHCRFYAPKKKETKRKGPAKASMAYAERNRTAVKRSNPNSMGVIQLDLEGNVIAEYQSQAQAAKAVGMRNCGGISQALDSETRTSGGYRWKRAPSADGEEETGGHEEKL